MSCVLDQLLGRSGIRAMWRIWLSLFAMATLLATVSFWHGATDSPLSKSALYFLPFIPVAFLFGFTLRRLSKKTH